MKDLFGLIHDLLHCIIVGHETIATWEFGHCSRWDKSGHPRISRDVKGHLRPGTLMVHSYINQFIIASYHIMCFVFTLGLFYAEAELW